MSDKTLKDTINPIDNSLDKINQLGGYTYTWKDNPVGNQGLDTGVLAQEVENILPGVVITREDGYKAVNYYKLIPLLIEGIKEQQKQIDYLTNKINNM